MVWWLKKKIPGVKKTEPARLLGYTKGVPRKFDLAKISAVMTKDVTTIKESTPVQTAAGLMKRRGIRGLVVVDGREVKGIVTDRDIVEKVAALNKSAKRIKVSGIMTPKEKLIVARPDEDVVSVGKRMRKAAIGRIPIVTEEGRLVGIVTETDLTRVYPGIVEVLYEELEEKGLPVVPDRDMMPGKCERCGNYSEFLTKTDEEWLCDVCGAEYTRERAR